MWDRSETQKVHGGKHEVMESRSLTQPKHCVVTCFECTTFHTRHMMERAIRGILDKMSPVILLGFVLSSCLTKR